MEARGARPFCDAGPEAGVPTKPRKRSQLGKGGWKVGKSTGSYRITTRFYRVEPDNSTQVVDFPHIGVVRHFLDANFANERELGRERRKPSQAETSSANWHMLVKACPWRRIGLKRRERRAPGKSHGRCGKRPYHAQRCILAAIFKTELSLMFAYVRLKSLMFAYFEQNVFFSKLVPIRCEHTRCSVPIINNRGLDAGRGRGDFSSRELQIKTNQRAQRAIQYYEQ